jgi:hypothetical protein
MTSLSDVPSTYIIKHRRDNQEVGRSVSDEPGLTVALTYKGGKCEHGCLPVQQSATIGR